jgi:hypothetical protein
MNIELGIPACGQYVLATREESLVYVGSQHLAMEAIG